MSRDKVNVLLAQRSDGLFLALNEGRFTTSYSFVADPNKAKSIVPYEASHIKNPKQATYYFENSDRARDLWLKDYNSEIMLTDCKTIIDSTFAERCKIGPVEWCEANVDFALNYGYPTEYKGRWDSSFLPFWNEPLENCYNPEIREQALLKPSQAGGTENVPLNAIRYAVGNSPRRCLYVWGDQKAAEDDFRERIVGGLRCGSATADKLKGARNVECRLDFADMSIVGAWPKNKMAFKRNPWSLIIADEFSTFPGMTPGMIRKRCDTVPFSHIVWISSPDPTMKQTSDDDPIFMEYRAGDQRKWTCKDPKTGNPFVFVMGGDDVPHGLKWDANAKRDDGTWDLQAVRETAHYVTPDGTLIENDLRMTVVRAGEWVASNPSAPEWRRSYHLNAFMMPFKSGDFGNIAVEFLQAKRQGVNQLKVFVYEYLAEPFYETREVNEESVMVERQGDYKRGEQISEIEVNKEFYIAKQKSNIITIDVQKDHFWWNIREWIDTGDSGLIAWGHCVETAELDGLADDYNVGFGGIDYGWAYREYEVLQYALEGKNNGSQWIIPLRGKDRQNSSLIFSYRDPYLGKSGQGVHSVETYTWETDTFRSLYMQMIRGESRENWQVYKGIESEYAKQATALEKVDGSWQNRRGHTQDHQYDCECMQLVIARIVGLYQNRMVETITERNGEDD